jgi:hypothetical protein
MSGIHKMKKQELKNVIKHYNRHTKGGKIKHGNLRKEQLRDIVQNLVGGGNFFSGRNRDISDHVTEEIQNGVVDDGEVDDGEVDDVDDNELVFPPFVDGEVYNDDNVPIAPIANEIHVADAFDIEDRITKIGDAIQEINAEVRTLHDRGVRILHNQGNYSNNPMDNPYNYEIRQLIREKHALEEQRRILLEQSDYYWHPDYFN